MKRTQQAGSSQGRVHDSHALHGVVRRLSDKRVAALVKEYQAGATVYELSERFSINRETVSRHLHRQGVKMRRQGLAEQQIIDSARLYEQGWSCAKIARHYDVNPGTIWLKLRAIGVQMRDPHERSVSSVA